MYAMTTLLYTTLLLLSKCLSMPLDRHNGTDNLEVRDEGTQYTVVAYSQADCTGNPAYFSWDTPSCWNVPAWQDNPAALSYSFTPPAESGWQATFYAWTDCTDYSTSSGPSPNPVVGDSSGPSCVNAGFSSSFYVGN
jgi:hypothetical protein